MKASAPVTLNILLKNSLGAYLTPELLCSHIQYLVMEP